MAAGFFWRVELFRQMQVKYEEELLVQEGAANAGNPPISQDDLGGQGPWWQWVRTHSGNLGLLSCSNFIHPGPV